MVEYPPFRSFKTRAIQRNKNRNNIDRRSMSGQSGRVQQKIVHNRSAKQQDPKIQIQRHLKFTPVAVQKVGIRLRIEQLIYILFNQLKIQIKIDIISQIF